MIVIEGLRRHLYFTPLTKAVSDDGAAGLDRITISVVKSQTSSKLTPDLQSETRHDKQVDWQNKLVSWIRPTDRMVPDTGHCSRG